MLQNMKHILTHTDETLLAKKFGYNNVEKFTKTKVLFFRMRKHTRMAFERTL